MRSQFAQLHITLQTFGFTEKEATVYVALLELGKGTVTEISRKAGINRTTGYDILDSLSNKGVISVSGKEPKQEYAAESPTTITAYLKRLSLQTQAHIKKAEEITPELELLHAKRNRPKIRFYEGTDGLRQVYEDTLTSTETIRAYAHLEDLQTAIPNYFPEYYRRRASKNIHIRAIFPDSPGAKERQAHDVDEKRKTLLVPAETFDFSPEINIYNDKVMIASWREKLGIIIESTEIADAMKKIYELAWRGAEEINREKE